MQKYKRVLSTIVVPIAIVAVAASSPSAQQRADGSGERLIEAVERCRTSTDEAARLACYDRAADALIAARRSNAITILSREEVAEGQRAVFGLPVGSERIYGARTKLPPVQTLDSTVVRLSVAGRDTFTVGLQDGSVWRTTERGRYAPKVGDAVHIKRGALGSYLASFAGARSIRIERVR